MRNRNIAEDEMPASRTARGRAISIALLFSLPTLLFAQAPRPAVDQLSLMTDVSISSPVAGQPLVYTPGLVPWSNSSSLTDITISSTIPGGPVADFHNSELDSPTFGGPVIQWEPKLEFLSPVYDTSNVESLDTNARHAIGSDGTTVQFDWSSPPNTLVADGLFRMGGTSNLYVAWRRNGIFWEAALADGSSLTGVRANYFDAIGVTINSTAALGTFLMADGTAYDVSPYTLPAAVGTAGQLLVSDGTNLQNVSSPWGKASVTFTMSQTAAAETSHLIYSWTGSEPAAGTTYRIKAWGSIDNGSTSITFTPRIRAGISNTVVIASPNIVGTTTPQTVKPWRLEALVTFRTVGASGTVAAEMTLDDHTQNSGGAMTHDCDNSGTTAINVGNTTAGGNIELTWQLSATTGTPVVRTIGATIEIVKM